MSNNSDDAKIGTNSTNSSNSIPIVKPELIDHETEASMQQVYGVNWKEMNPSIFEQKNNAIVKQEKKVISLQTLSEEEYEDRMCWGLTMGHS
jgi:hypothetical protein